MRSVASVIGLQLILLAGFPRVCLAERINQEGRILGSAPVVTNALLFNSPEADAVVAALQIFPVDNAWNEDVSRRPVLSNSDAMIAQIMAELASGRRTLRAFYEMNYVLVPDDQPLVPLRFLDYPDESDPGPYPIPTNLPIETWPRETGNLTLYEWQVDLNNLGGDRHAIIVQPGAGPLFETWQTKLVNGSWQASNGAKFDLNSNELRPAGWTSGDAAGLPMFPALVRYDECQRGMVEHAMRLVVKHTRREYLYPARHYASVPVTTDPNVPAMGQRLRLKAGFNIPDAWTQEEKAVLRGLKKHGAIVADNGGFFSISVTPDDRYAPGAFDHLSSISITNFEVIQTAGPTEGPRAPGAPTASAGPDRTVAFGPPVTLEGFATWSSPVQVRWAVYAGPGTVALADNSRTNTTATFSAPGTYTLMLSVDDSLHAVAYDAVVLTVSPDLRLNAARNGTDLGLSWTGGTPPFTLESAPVLPATQWQSVLTTNATNVLLPTTGNSAFFRVQTP